MEDQDFLKEIIEDFKIETNQRIEKIENLLLSYSPDDESTGKEIKREFHTIKGSASMVGFDMVGVLSHKLEDFFKKVEERKIFNDNILSIFLQGTSLIKTYIKDKSKENEKTIQNFIEYIEKYEPEKNESQSTDFIIKNQETQDVETAPVSSQYTTLETSKLNDFLNILNEFIVKQEQMLGMKKDIKEIEKMSKKLLVDDRTIYLREKIETVYKFFKEYMDNSNIFVEKVKNYLHILKTQSISTIFNPLPSQVFKIAKSLGKNVNLTISGKDIELDRRIIAEISEPIVHMIRNALDHGIESPEERIKKGKQKVGHLSLSARYEGDNVYIELKDDGRGIDVEKIKEKALERNIVTKEELKTMNKKEIMELIFMPGFSTKAQVDMLSGRGIGMDIIKNKVTSLGGEVFIDSEENSYTKITLKLPITLGISQILMVKVGEFIFGFLSSHIRSILKIDKKNSILIGREKFLKFGETLSPIIDLSGPLSVEYIPKYYLLLSTGIRNFAIPVEDIIDEKSMIVRPLSDCIKKKLSLFNAFSIYQNGKLIPIIDSQKLYALKNKSQSIEEDLKKDSLEKEINSVLIVEDATVTRKMESMIMEEEGFKVYEASNGREAIEVLSNIPIPSIIITDIEMPILDGVEFVKYVKEELNLSVPIVVVTTLSKEELVKRDLKPVDLIIPKKDFAERKFIEKIRKLVKAKK